MTTMGQAQSSMAAGPLGGNRTRTSFFSSLRTKSSSNNNKRTTKIGSFLGRRKVNDSVQSFRVLSTNPAGRTIPPIPPRPHTAEDLLATQLSIRDRRRAIDGLPQILDPLTGNAHRLTPNDLTHRSNNNEPIIFMIGDEVVTIDFERTTTYRLQLGRDSTSASQKQCLLCMEFKSAATGFPDIVVSTCRHPAKVCFGCLTKWYIECMKTKGIDDITCPQCTQAVRFEEAVICLEPHQFEKVTQVRTDIKMRQNPNYHHCIQPHCQKGQLHNPTTPYMICQFCNFKQCPQHAVPWHHRETCTEYDMREHRSLHRKQDLASKTTIEKTCKLCPKCKAAIEKNDGCDHMMCTACTYHFCWLCMCDWIKASNDAQYHERSCTYYRPWRPISA